MKKLILASLIAVSSLTFTACQSTTETIYKTEAVVITTVDSAMKAWADYVRGGKATQQQVDTVKNAYNKYFAAQQVAKSAFISYVTLKDDNTKNLWQKAFLATLEAQDELVKLVNQFINK